MSDKQRDGFVFGHMQINETISTPEKAEKHAREAKERRRLFRIEEAVQRLRRKQKTP